MTNARTIADSAGEATVLDVTAGTAAASKAVVLDGSKNIATLGTVASGALTVTGASTITTADNTDTLSLISTDADASSGPNLRLYRNSSSPVNDDVTGVIQFEGRNNNSQDFISSEIKSVTSDVADGTEDGALAFSVMNAGTLQQVAIFTGPEVVFNETSNDIDFRVESNGDVNRFKVDAGTDTVLFGTGTADTVGGDVVANQIFGTGAATGALSIVRGVASTASGSLVFGKTRNTTYGSRTVVQDGDRLGNIIFHGDDGSDLNSQGAIIAAEVDGTPGNNDMPGRLIFLTTADGASSATEKLRIASTGQTTLTSSINDVLFYVKNTETSGNVFGQQINFSSTVNDTGSYFFRCVGNNNSTVRAVIFANGDFDSATNSYGATSDERIKQNITDANSQWDDIKALKVRNFKLKDEARTETGGGQAAKTYLGLVAQETETVSPGLVKLRNPEKADILSSSEFGTLYTADDSETQDAVLYTSDDQEVIDGDKNVGDIKTPSTKKVGDIKEIKDQVKSVSYSVLYMKAIKALQEAQTRIETLETKVAALEG